MKRFAILTVLLTLVTLPLLAADTPAQPSAPCCLKQAGAQRTVTNLDNGVKITITGADAKLAAMIQEETAACPKPGCPQDCPIQAKGVTRTVEKTENGVVITATSADPATVATLQEHAATMWDRDCPHKAAASCPKAKAMSGQPACPHAKATAPAQS